MKILVPVKRVIDANIRVRIKSDHSGIETTGVKLSMNPFCEIAVEEAVRLKESGKASEVIVISIGAGQCQDVIRTALAMGADRGVLIETALDLQPFGIAKLLQALVKRESPDLVVLGKQAIDDDNNQTGQMLAGLLNWPQGTFISDLKIDNEKIKVTREIDGGTETLSLNLPAVVTTDLRLNEPRYVKLPNMMKAKKAPLEVLAADTFNVDIVPKQTILKVEEPPLRKKGIKVASVAQLVDKLRHEAGVIS